jgi:hypothetical protein
MRWYRRLPGPAAVRLAIVVVIAAAVVALLLLAYDWLGRVLLDSGGVMGWASTGP